MSVPSIIAQGRRLIATAFLDRCVIGDRSTVRDTTGGLVATWTNRTGSPVPCWFTSLADEAPAAVAGTVFGVPTATWLAPITTVCKEGDRLTNLADGSKWIITSNLTPPSATAVAVRMGIRRADRGEVG